MTYSGTDSKRCLSFSYLGTLYGQKGRGEGFLRKLSLHFQGFLEHTSARLSEGR